MCDCDCDLTKEEKWRKVRERAFRSIGVDAVVVPRAGVHLVVDGVVRPAVRHDGTYTALDDEEGP